MDVLLWVNVQHIKLNFNVKLLVHVFGMLDNIMDVLIDHVIKLKLHIIHIHYVMEQILVVLLKLILKDVYH